MPKTGAPSDLADKFVLRLPPGLKDRLAAAAKETGRSINSEIVGRLEQSLERFSSIEHIAQQIDELRKELELIRSTVQEHDRKLGRS